MPELNFDHWTGPLVIEYAGLCPHFGQEVPSEFVGCSECPVAQNCYEVWNLKEKNGNVRLERRSAQIRASGND